MKRDKGIVSWIYDKKGRQIILFYIPEGEPDELVHQVFSFQPSSIQ